MAIYSEYSTRMIEYIIQDDILIITFWVKYVWVGSILKNWIGQFVTWHDSICRILLGRFYSLSKKGYFTRFALKIKISMF